ncbi:MAG: SIS domain-containing protein [Fimbriimonadaceae bacterium]|nr:SIS domain-containing protein [Fimbriimonadaceae bacterium]
MRSMVLEELMQAQAALANLITDEAALSKIEQGIGIVADCLRSGGRVWSAGNGGSMCDAMHFAEELSGRYRHDRPALAAIAFSDPGYLTCVGNDYGFEHVYSRAVQAHCKPGDVLVLFSTSGSSKNILAAAEAAKAAGVTVLGLTGKADSPLAARCDLCLATPGGQYADRVQELHIKVVHILIAGVERLLFNT